ncbi:LysR family transcriptional regulator [Vibrio navarrensis]|uniref:LysR family transcriptional regulator n=1 Tax=Vibrio navarrensis TaxID=29495 RepID=UPI00186A9CA6|nr:LysR family transcriptional regulator [Vibrio navarrensis]
MIQINSFHFLYEQDGMKVLGDLNWKNMDLNLLVVFSQLYRYRSVSVAAEMGFVSQSAMSHSLGRLRIMLDDPLFERKGHKMEPTEYAHKIAPFIDGLLESISRELLTRREFYPSQFEGVCRIGLTDYAEFIFAAQLYDAIRSEAPNAQVSFVNVNRQNYLSLTEQEKLDVVIGSIPQLDSKFCAQYLYTERHVCLCDPKLIDVQGMTLEKFAALEQALVSTDGSLTTQTDKTLASYGLSRRVSLASRNFLTIRHLLAGRELIAIVPERMAKANGFDDGLVTFQPPLAVADFDISLVWHSSATQSDKGLWLRGVVKASIE